MAEDVGLDSLAAVELHNALRIDFGLELAPTELLDRLSLTDLVRRISETGPGQRTGAEQGRPADGVPPQADDPPPSRCPQPFAELELGLSTLFQLPFESFCQPLPVFL